LDADADWRTLPSVITRLDRVIHAIPFGAGATDVGGVVRAWMARSSRAMTAEGVAARVIDICAACVQ
jgi:hypothetical protein